MGFEDDGGKLFSMNIKKLTAAVSLCLVVVLSAGCSTVAGYQTMAQSWTGQTEQARVAGWGAPNGVSDAGGYRAITFTRFFGYQYAYGYYGYGYAYPQSCTTTFTLQNGIVLGSSFQGNSCTAP